jgi:hypothetical protein
VEQLEPHGKTLSFPLFKKKKKFVAALWFELRVLHLLGKFHHLSHTSSPFALVILEIGS